MDEPRYYSDEYIWIAPLHKRIVRLGLSYAIREHVGDILHVDLPSVGENCTIGEVFVILESSKSAVEVLSPVSGEILEINKLLIQDSQLLNHSPESKGWIALVKLHEDFDCRTFNKS